MIAINYILDTTDPVRMLTNDLLDRGQPILAMGPTGCGKTEHLKHWAASRNRVAYQVQGHPTLTFDELVGEDRLNPDGPGAKFRYGVLAKAMKFGGLVILDEGPACEPCTLNALNEISNGGNLTITNGDEAIETIERHPEFGLAITGNPWQEYVGNNAFSPALVDRFYVRNWTYLKAETETRIIRETFRSIDEATAGNLVGLANEIRNQVHDRRRAKYVLTTRGLQQTAYLISELRLDPGMAIAEVVIPAALMQSRQEAEAIVHMAKTRGFDVPAIA